MPRALWWGLRKRFGRSLNRLLAEDSPEKAHAALRDTLRGGAAENSLAEVYTKVENRLLGEAGRAEGGVILARRAGSIASA